MAGLVLVTGANGFLGRHVVRALQEQGTPVRGLVRTLGEAEAPEGVELVEGDVTEPGTLGDHMKDYVAHLERHLAQIFEGA